MPFSSYSLPCRELNVIFRDYIVIGGGNAGLTVAARLAETASVAVIEAGGFYEIGNSNLSQIPLDDIYFAGKDRTDYNPLIDWGFYTTPQAVSQIMTESSNGS